MVQLLAEELGLRILSWTEATTDPGGWGGQQGRGDEAPLLPGWGQGQGMGAGAGEYMSHAEDFGNFLRGAAYKPLQLQAVGVPPPKVRGAPPGLLPCKYECTYIALPSLSHPVATRCNLIRRGRSRRRGSGGRGAGRGAGLRARGRWWVVGGGQAGCT
jgi:hypothetical protein